MSAENMRVYEQGRLVYYREPADAQYWDEHWGDSMKPRVFQKAARGDLGFFERPFVNWLPRDGKILEAGCGLGNVVMALISRGWDVEGVDYAEHTVANVLRRYPDLPLRVGDVSQLDVPANHYAGYISLGVIEHRREGPEPFLTEAYRVLRGGGVAIITTPYLNGLRRWKAERGHYSQSAEGKEFYQYAFSQQELRRHIESAGFEVFASMPYNGLKGLKDEIGWGRYPLKIARRTPLINSVIKRRLCYSRLGHMLLIAARKPVDPLARADGAIKDAA